MPPIVASMSGLSRLSFFDSPTEFLALAFEGPFYFKDFDV